MAKLINKENDMPFYIWSALVGIGFTIGMSFYAGRFKPDALYFLAGAWVLYVGASLIARWRGWK